MYYPTLEEIRTLQGNGNITPIYTEIDAGSETPVSAYLKVARHPYSFLLESIEGGEQIARYSFIGTEPIKVIKTGIGYDYGKVDPLIPIKQALDDLDVISFDKHPRFNGGAVGYLSYDAVNYFEKLPVAMDDPLNLPESVFMLNTTFLIFDHIRNKIRLVSHVNLDGNIQSEYVVACKRIDELISRLKSDLEPSGSQKPINIDSIKSNMSRQEHEKSVNKIIKYIYEGDCIQVVLSQRFSRKTDVSPLDIYRALREINPSPYMFYLELDGFQILGSSPEMLVRNQNGHLDYHPIAGTRPRGSTPEQDLELGTELQNDEKEKAEHIMLLDLGRNDIGRVSKTGTVNVTQMMDVERYSHVMHLVSHVTGELKPELNSYDALRSCFPAGTLSGAPKVRAMEIIAELEPHKRGAYAGAIGYFDLTGNMDTAIALRTMVVKDGVAYVQAGGGIVADSNPESEYQETVHKSAALFRAIEKAESDPQRMRLQ